MTVERLVFPALRWRGRAVDEVWPEVSGAIDQGVGGFVVFGGDLSVMRELAGRAFERAGRPLLFAADLERGAGQQLTGATSLPPPAALAQLDEAALQTAARITAREASAAGIGWVLAPVADLDVEPANPIVGTRSFGESAEAVAQRVGAWIVAAQQEGIHACAKHFPGHGRTTVDSHAALPALATSRDVLEGDLLPFRAAVDAGVRSVMMAHVSYLALDASGLPASLSPVVVGQLREELGFEGLVATDAMIMDAVSAGGPGAGKAAVAAVRAGCDVVLYPPSVEDVIAELGGAARSGVLPATRVEEAAERVEAAAKSARVLAGGMALSPGRALEMAVASLRPLRGERPRLTTDEPLRVQVIDDDQVSLPAHVAAPGSGERDRGVFGQGLAARGARLTQAPGRAVDLVALFSDVRAWKGRAGLAPPTVAEVTRIVAGAPEAIVVLFGHPRLADQLPGDARVLCAWCGDALMQEAAAERLVGPERR